VQRVIDVLTDLVNTLTISSMQMDSFYGDKTERMTKTTTMTSEKCRRSISQE
jgi:hypothetical protein